MKNKSVVKGFLEFKKSRGDLIEFFGEDLLNATGMTLKVSIKNVIAAIDKYLCGDITKNQHIEWVNIL